MTPDEGFESAQWLAGWAKTQFDELQTLIKAFDDSGSATVVKEINRKTRRNELKLRLKPVPHRIRGLTNNIIKDLRDALDQATSAAAFLITGKERRNAHFPFGTSPNDFDTAVQRNQCKDIPAALYPALKSYQPYPTGHGWEGGNNFLRLLGSVSGKHKHRFTLAVTVDPSSVSVSNGRISFGNEGGGMFIGRTRKDEFVILALSAGGQANFDLSYTCYVGFADTKLKDISVDAFLSACCAAVGDIVQDLQAQALRLAQPT